MTYVIEVEIIGLPHTQNALGRRNYQVKAREARKWIDAVIMATNGMKPHKPLVKAKLTLTRFSSVCPDFDGLCSSFKHPVDGLIKAGIIIDDKMSVIGQPNYKWEKAAPKKGRIKIKVESVE